MKRQVRKSVVVPDKGLYDSILHSVYLDSVVS